jgi:hypothetical protein
VGAYASLRDGALRMSPEGLGVSPIAGEAYGVIMDMDVSGATATLAAFATGDASFYLSSGGAVIGGFAHPEVANAARALVAQAGTHAARMEPAAEFPRPRRGEVRFYVLTREGVRTAAASEDDLGEGRSPLSPLFLSAHEVITGLRRAAERAERR